MDLGGILLGLAGIALGVNTFGTGAKRLAEGMRPPAQVRQPGVRTIPGRVPTMVIPREATRRLPPLKKQGVPVRTSTGLMGTSLYEVTSLRDRLAIIIDRANEGMIDPKIIAWARQQVSQRKPGSTEWNGGQWLAPEKNGAAELELLFKGTRRSLRYVSDPRGVDLYAKPRKTLETGAGDCDEATAVVCAAAKAIGKKCDMVVIETLDSKEGPNHIYPVAYSDGKRYPMDASVPMPFGWEAPDSMVRRRWVFETE